MRHSCINYAVVICTNSQQCSVAFEFSVQYGTPWHFMEVVLRLTQGVDVVTESQCNPGHVVCMSLPTRQCSLLATPRKSMWHGNLTATESTVATIVKHKALKVAAVCG